MNTFVDSGKADMATGAATTLEAAARYERKFVFDGWSRSKIIRKLMVHPALFREIYHERFVNNIYFDTIDRRYFWESVEGSTQRVKVRIRWYGEAFGTVGSAVLEFKLKDGLAVRKESFPISEFSVGMGMSLAYLKCLLRSAPMDESRRRQVLGLTPVLLNRYRRRYYLSADAIYRITIDDGLESYRLKPMNNVFLDRNVDQQHAILELKYSTDQSELADRVAGMFPVRVTRWSKYVNGLAPYMNH